MPSGFVMPTAPYAPGNEPTAVEYEFTSPSGDTRTVIAPLYEAVEYQENERRRYRYLWGSKPGAWDDRGVPWQKPRP